MTEIGRFLQWDSVSFQLGSLWVGVKCVLAPIILHQLCAQMKEGERQRKNDRRRERAKVIN